MGDVSEKLTALAGVTEDLSMTCFSAWAFRCWTGEATASQTAWNDCQCWQLNQDPSSSVCRVQRHLNRH